MRSEWSEVVKKILVLCEDYPSEGKPYKMAWAHTRNVLYVRAGFEVHVCSFSAASSYEFQGVRVLPAVDLPADPEAVYHCLIAHSPNIRHHLWLMLRFKSKPVIFFSHGNDAMYINRDYPAPYAFSRLPVWKRLLRDLYDHAKMQLWRWYMRGRRQQLTLVFVSQWMKDRFVANIMDPDEVNVRSHIIPNPLWPDFYVREYSDEREDSWLADFVTLRPLDGSKYAVDLVVALARSNPDYSFHVVGEGEFFRHFSPPANLTWIRRHVPQPELASFLRQYRCALMPTRVDAQGVMACEIASFGMPLITSDIPVCREMFAGYPNVLLLSDAGFSQRLGAEMFPAAARGEAVKSRFSLENTVDREIALISALI